MRRKMYIEQIETLEKGRRKILFENGMELLLYRGDVRENELKEGMDIPDELYEKLLYDLVGKRAKKRAMHLLEKQDRTEYQLREKLCQHYPQEVIEDAIAYVRSYHYLDDLRYACNYISCQKEKKSRRRLQQDLMKKGVDKRIIEEALETEGSGDEREAIRILLEKKGYHENMGRQEAHKLYQFLLRRGYQSADILCVMRSALEDENNDFFESR